MYDPKLGRFLTIDLIVSNLYFGQSLNGPPPSTPDDPRSDAAEFGAAAPPTDVDTTGSSPEVTQGSTTAPEEQLESSAVIRGGLGFAYGVGQAWLPGGVLVPSAQPKDGVFEFWRGAGQFTAGVVEVVAGAGLISGGGAAASGGIAAAVPTGGASLLVIMAGGSAVTAGWAAVGHGATGIVAGIATIGDSLSLSRGSGSGSLSTEGGLGTPVNKVVNSNMPHAAERAVERAGFRTLKEARTALQEFGAGIEKSGLPRGAIRDTAHADRVIVPGFGQGGAVVYQVKDGTLKLKTVLE